MLTRPPARKSVNVSIDARLLAEAKALSINISRAAEAGIADAIATRRAELWLEENREAIDRNNRHFDEHGLPFAEYRGF